MGCCGAAEDVTADVKFKVLRSKWDIDEKAIGEGGFGTVHLAKNIKTGKVRALKAMRLYNEQDRDDFVNEVTIMKKIRTHRNICHLIQGLDDPKYGYLVMQACTGGELFDRITDGNYTEKDAAMAVVDVLSALSFIHSKNIIHRDLKPENLLYKDKDPGSPLKLVDFGLAIQIAPKQKIREVCGTTSYMAPEVLLGPYGCECDEWSLGVMVFFMLSGTLPFSGKTDDEKETKIVGHTTENLKKLMSKRRWQNVSAEGKDFVVQLLQRSPLDRMTGKHALKHAWIKNIPALSQNIDSEVAISLKKYSEQHRFQRAVRHRMATQYTATELHRVRNMFEAIDTDSSGSITIAELTTALKENSADSEAIKALASLDLSSFDMDGDGCLDWKEFVAAIVAERELYSEENLDKAFDSIDVNSDGKISFSELKQLLGDSHEVCRDIQAILSESRKSQGQEESEDLNMSKEEFKKLVQSHLPKCQSRRTKTRATRASVEEQV